MPFVFVLGAVGLVNEEKYMKRLMAFLVAFFISMSLVNDYKIITNPEKANLPRTDRSGYLEEWTAGTGIAEAANIIKTEHMNNPEKKIVVGTEGYFGTLPDGMQMYLNRVENVQVFGTGLDFGEVPQPLIDSVKEGNKTYFVVNSSRLKFGEDEFEGLGLKVVQKYKKADRPDGFKEFVQHGPYDTFYLLEVK